MNHSVLFKKKWQAALCLTVLFIIALGIRVYDLTDLPFDFHPARQFQSMLKARGMFYQSNPAGATEAQIEFAVQQWKVQPVQEPEIMEHLALWTYRLIGHEDIFFPRLYAIFFWLLGGVALYLFLHSMISTDGAVVGLAFYLFCPYGISASRAFMPDLLMVAALLWSIWAIWRWYEKPGWGRAILAGLLCGLTIYVKLTAVFFIGGIIIGLALGQYGFKKALRMGQFWVMGVLALLPGVTYNIIGIYVKHFIGKSAVINRLIPSMLVSLTSYINWNNMIVTVVGFVAFFLGLVGIFLLDSRAKRSLLIGFWAGYLLFGIVFIYYFTTHDYYHIALIPLTAIGLAALGDVLIRKSESLIRPGWLFRAVMIVALFGCVAETVWQVRNDFKRTDYRSEAAFWEKLGNEMQGYSTLAMTEDYNGRLSYYGWYAAAYMPELNELMHRELTGHGGDIKKTFASMSKNYDLFLVTLLDDLDQAPAFKNYLDQTYPVFDQGDGYIIYDLRNR